MQPYAVFDIDGVLADVRHRLHHLERRPKRWDRFFAAAPDDAVLAAGHRLVQRATAVGLQVVYSTGRPAPYRADTERWLAASGFPDVPLYMRRAHDRRPGRLMKLQTARMLRDQGSVAFLVDDDPVVVRELRQDGFAVVHAAWMFHAEEPGPVGSPAAGAPESAQGVLFDAQEAGDV